MKNKSFWIKWCIGASLAIIVTQVFSIRSGEPFTITSLLIRVISGFIGFGLGLFLRWFEINIRHAEVGDIRDKIFSIILPFLVACILALVVPLGV